MKHGNMGLDGGEKDYDFERGQAKDSAGQGATLPEGGYDFEKGCVREGHGLGLEGDYDNARARQEG